MDKEKSIWELLAELTEMTKQLEKDANELKEMSERMLINPFNLPISKKEPTVQELTISEMVGRPVKIQK